MRRKGDELSREPMLGPRTVAGELASGDGFSVLSRHVQPPFGHPGGDLGARTKAQFSEDLADVVVDRLLGD